jgi:hypothetical protein
MNKYKITSIRPEGLPKRESFLVKTLPYLTVIGFIIFVCFFIGLAEILF